MTSPTTPAASGCPVNHGGLDPNGCPISAQAAAFNPFEPAYMRDPAQYLRWAREQEPVFWSPQLGYWVVTRYEDVKAVFRDNIVFSPAIALEKITPATPQVLEILKGYGFAMNRTMVNEDEPDHMARRRLLMDDFLPDRLIRYEPMVRDLARQYMDRFVDSGRADLVGAMFYEIPLNIALRFLGVSEEGSERLRQFAVAHTLNTWGKPTAQEQLEIAENVGRFWQTAQEILSEMMANPQGEGWMVESVRQHLKHPEIVTESYLRSMMMAILAAAHETTSNATANAFMTLLSQPKAWEAICANPALIPNAVEECLRVAGSIIAWRRIATCDTVVGGVHIAEGSKLLIVQISANADADHFENPEVVDLYRENAVEHMTFGYGAHQCMGKNIGRMQMRVFLEEFARRLPHMRLVEDQQFEFLSNTSFRGPAQLWVTWEPAQNPERKTPALATQRPSDFSIGPPRKDAISRTVIVRERHTEGDGLTRFVLGTPDGESLPQWRAGAHVELIAGGFRRRYSLCGDPQAPDQLEVVIHRDANGRGGSQYFSDHLMATHSLQLSGPKNLFKLDESASHFVLIAGGIGITPIVAMADRLKELGKSYTLHYAGHARERMALLARIQRDHGAALSLHIATEGSRMDVAGLFTKVPAGTGVYACGPNRLITELETLSDGWPENSLHFEHFSAGGAALDPGQAQAFVAVLRDSNLELTVPANQTLFETLQAAGVDIACDCGEGLCGTCEVGVVAGAIDHRDKVLTKSERGSNTRMMTCCSRALGERIVLAI